MEEKIGIVHEDDGMLVLNKPAGWITTRENYKLQITNYKFVEDWVGENYPNNLPRKGIVHRLDKGTSGLLVVAKNEKMLLKLKEEFKRRKIEKKYLALVAAEVPDRGVIKVPVGRLRGRGKFGVVVEGKEAETIFEVVGRFNWQGRQMSLLQLQPKTGRTHQIRVHLRYMGWPIVGDEKYGGPAAAGLNRPFLHAAELAVLGKCFRAKMPDDLEDVLKKYEKID